MNNQSLLRTIALCVAVAAPVLAGHVGDADANPRGRRARGAQAAEAGRAALTNRARKFAPREIPNHVRRKLGNKPVMQVNGKNFGKYLKSMKKDSIEVLFQPGASQWGHIYIRVGDRILDFPNQYQPPRNVAMRAIGSATYGFAFKVGEQKVKSLQKEFEKLIRSRPKFSEMGGGDTLSCASFVTSVLSEHLPELRVGRSVAAVGVGRSLLNSAKVDAVTLHGRVDLSDNFKFAKLE